MTPSATVGPHGTTTEKDGCPCDWCKQAHYLRIKRWRIRRARGEAGLVDIATPRKQLRQIIRKTGWTQRAAARQLGTNQRYIWWLLNSTDKSHVTVGRARQIADMHADYCTPETPDLRRWPTDPARQAILARYGSLRNASQGGTYVARVLREAEADGLTSQAADRLAVLVGKLPSEIWENYK